MKKSYKHSDNCTVEARCDKCRISMSKEEYSEYIKEIFFDDLSAFMIWKLALNGRWDVSIIGGESKKSALIIFYPDSSEPEEWWVLDCFESKKYAIQFIEKHKLNWVEEKS